MWKLLFHLVVSQWNLQFQESCLDRKWFTCQVVALGWLLADVPGCSCQVHSVMCLLFWHQYPALSLEVELLASKLRKDFTHMPFFFCVTSAYFTCLPLKLLKVIDSFVWTRLKCCSPGTKLFLTCESACGLPLTVDVVTVTSPLLFALWILKP